jgi:hypothetical protein
MTKDQAIVGAKIVKPGANNIKLSLRCGDSKTKNILIDRELLNAEEKILTTMKKLNKQCSLLL